MEEFSNTLWSSCWLSALCLHTNSEVKKTGIYLVFQNLRLVHSHWYTVLPMRLDQLAFFQLISSLLQLSGEAFVHGAPIIPTITFLVVKHIPSSILAILEYKLGFNANSF